MVALAGPYFMFAALLVISGLPKLSNPASTARALEGIGLPARRWLGQAVGIVEIVVGVSAIAIGGRVPALAVGLLYVGFAGFIVVAMRSSSVKTCGCFGADDTPPSALHLVIDVAAAGFAAALFFNPIGDITAVMGATPWAGLPLLLLVVLGAWLSLMVLALLPAVFEEARA
ncbi:MAG: DoxX family membrane protein [Acidimicrobiia bacterium]|nr:DoxX family membrane protein [Acidimicrobiia bacterium]